MTGRLGQTHTRLNGTLCSAAAPGQNRNAPAAMEGRDSDLLRLLSGQHKGLVQRAQVAGIPG